MGEEQNGISLSEFLSEEERRLRRFVAYWNKQHMKSPHYFPLWMEPGEWDEQYQAFCSMENDE